MMIQGVRLPQSVKIFKPAFSKVTIPLILVRECWDPFLRLERGRLVGLIGSF